MISGRRIALCLALTAIVALSGTAGVASAMPAITHPTGTLLKTPAKITATNLGLIKLTGDVADNAMTSTIVECNLALLTGTLEKNSKAEGIVGTIETALIGGTGAAAKCTGLAGVSFTTGGGSFKTGLPWCFQSFGGGTDQFEIRGGKCTEATRPVTFILDTASSECTYESPNMTGTFTTDPIGGANQDAVFTITSANFKREAGSGFSCPLEQWMDLQFTLETDSVAQEPLYIS